MGDINGDNIIDDIDVKIIRGLIGQVIPRPTDLCCIDLNKNGRADSADTTRIRRIIAGINVSPGQCPEAITPPLPSPPTAPIIDSFTISPETILQGQQATLSWTLSGGTPTTLEIDNSVGSVLEITSISVAPNETTTYTITATNDAYSVTKSVTITVNTPPPPPTAPIIDSFTVSPETIIQGQQVTLSWTLSGSEPTTLEIDNNVGSVLQTTSTIVSPTVTTNSTSDSAILITYMLTASNNLGANTKSVTIALDPLSPPIISDFSASPTTITSGESATLSWALNGGQLTTLEIDNGINYILGSTSITVSPTETTTYTITATNNSGAVSMSVTINVNPIAFNFFNFVKKIIAKVFDFIIPTAYAATETIISNYQYDQNGNVLADENNTYVYDYNNHLISVTNTKTGTVSTYAYEASGQRIKSTITTIDQTTTTTYYPNSNYNSASTKPAGSATPTETTITKHI